MAITYQEYERFAGEINLLLGGERMSLDDMLTEIESIITLLELGPYPAYTVLMTEDEEAIHDQQLRA